MEKAAPGLTMLQVGLDAGSSPVHLLETPFNVLVVVVKLCGARPADIPDRRGPGVGIVLCTDVLQYREKGTDVRNSRKAKQNCGEPNVDVCSPLGKGGFMAQLTQLDCWIWRQGRPVAWALHAACSDPAPKRKAHRPQSGSSGGHRVVYYVLCWSLAGAA